MLVRTLSTALAVLMFSTPLVLADAPRLAAQQCAVNTRAPGNYYISNAPGLASVLPGPSGSPDGAARINDCLKDVYAVQYGTKCDQVAPANVTPATVASCSVVVTAPRVEQNPAIYVGCSRKNGVMNRGTRLCVAP